MTARSKRSKEVPTAADFLNKIKEDENCKLSMLEVQAVLLASEEKNNRLEKIVKDQGAEIQKLRDDIEKIQKENDKNAKEKFEAKEDQIVKEEENEKLKKDVKEQKQEMDALRKKNTQVLNDIKEIRKTNIKMAEEAKEEKEKQYFKAYKSEAKATDSNLMIKNVAMDEETEKEGQTLELVKEIFFNNMGVDKSVKIEEVTRFSKSKKATGNKPPVIRVKLANFEMKKKIFKQISTLKDSEKFNRISIQNEYPAMIRKQLQAREKEAWGIRSKSNFTLKTKVEVKKGRPQILVKAAEETEFRPPKEEEYLRLPEEEESDKKGTKKDKKGGKKSNGASTSNSGQ